MTRSNHLDSGANQRYAAMLLFQFRVVTAGKSNKRRLCEKRLILITASDGVAALRAAKRRGRQGQHNYLNRDGARVKIQFVGVLDLLHLGPECEPDEVYYQLCRMNEPMERRKHVLPPESQLQALAEHYTATALRDRKKNRRRRTTTIRTDKTSLG